MLSPRPTQVRTMHQRSGTHAHINGQVSLGPDAYELESFPSSRSEGFCCRCSTDFSAKAPRVHPKELFVNVTVRAIEDDHPVKNVHDWMAGVMGQVMGGGKNQFTGTISMNYFKENEFGIKAEVMKAFHKRGWFVELAERYSRSAFYVDCREAIYTVGAGNLAKLVDKQEADRIGMEIQQGLKQNQSLRGVRPITADVTIGDAYEEMHVLYNMKWSEDEAATCILSARKRKPDVQVALYQTPVSNQMLQQSSYRSQMPVTSSQVREQSLGASFNV